MGISSQTKRRFAAATALRGAIMLFAGLYAVLFPDAALTVLVLFGGALLLIDGVLGLWSLTFGGGKSGNYWFDIAANAASVVLGIVFFLWPLLATIFTLSVFGTVVGIAAILVGGMQVWVVVKERASYARIWPVVLSGLAYIALGLLFLVFPILSATVGMLIGGIMLIVFSFGLFGWAWRLYQSSKTAA